MGHGEQTIRGDYNSVTRCKWTARTCLDREQGKDMKQRQGHRACGLYLSIAATSTAREVISSTDHLSLLGMPCFKSNTSPTSSHDRRMVSISSLVCAAETQKRTRLVTRGVAGYATTTTTMGVWRSFIMRWNMFILPGLNKSSGTIGESSCPYVIKPSLVNARERYRALKARRRKRMRPSEPSRSEGGRLNQDGKLERGAGPGWL